MTEDEMVGWHHRLSGHEFEQTPENSEGQGSLACCSPWGHRELDMPERLNNQSSNSGNKISASGLDPDRNPRFLLTDQIYLLEQTLVRLL